GHARGSGGARGRKAGGGDRRADLPSGRRRRSSRAYRCATAGAVPEALGGWSPIAPRRGPRAARRRDTRGEGAMFTINDPEVGAEELTRRVREELHRRQAVAGPARGEPAPDGLAPQSWAAAHRAIAVAERYSTVGATLPPMTTIQGLKRKLVVPLAKLI